MVQEFDVLNLSNPYGFYEQARLHSPIFYDEKSKYWIVTTFKEVERIIKDEHNFSARLDRVNYKDISAEALSVLCPINFQKLYGLSTTENPSHDKVKKVLMPIWNKLFKEVLSPKIDQYVQAYLNKLTGKKEFDILKDVFEPLPARIIFSMLGIEESRVEEVKAWSNSRLQLTWGEKDKQLHHAQNIVKYWQFTGELLRHKLEHPDNDLPSILLEYYHIGELSMHDIQLLCYGLIFSGHATTSAFLAESLKVLFESGLWQKHLSLGVPFSNSADELLRLCPSAFTRRRITLNDTIVGDHFFREGDEILLVIGSANRDEQIFPNTNQALLNRENAKRHLSLGRGFHYCIGAKLVKLEYEIIMQALQDKFPCLSISADNKFEYLNNISIRCLKSLKVSTVCY